MNIYTNTTSPFETSTGSSSVQSPPHSTSTSYQSNSTAYESALDSLPSSPYNSFNESANNNSPIPTLFNSNASTDSNATLQFNNTSDKSGEEINKMNANTFLLQSESTETNTSQEEVDPKSQLANKTIFKTDNPNLSIIEISNNSSKDQDDLENSVVLIESLPEDDVEKIRAGQWKSPNKSGPTAVSSTTATQDRRRKPETLLNARKQKLNVAIAEASAANEHNSDLGALHKIEVVEDSNENDQPNTKREIKLYETLEEFEQNLPSTVTVLDTPFGSKVYLVGTAHFSEESQDDVSFVIRNVRPDVVMVELCPSRIHILKMDEKTLLEEAKSFNLAKIRGILQAHGYINGVFFIMLLQMSAQIAKDLGMAPGGEFRRAFDEIRKLPGCLLHLGDRPIRITLHRALRALSWWQTAKLVYRLLQSDSISIEEVEECKQRDLLEKLMQEMAGEFPAFSEVFVHERDLYLTHSLQMAALPQMTPGGMGEIKPVRVVGVVGIGHANGIAKLWGHVEPSSIPPIMQIPPSGLGTRICKFTFKYGLIGLTLYGAVRVFRPRLARFF